MTGSGMGCPDWPKCFGYYIPPTDDSTVQWERNRAYKKGQMILKDEALYMANENIKTSSEFQADNWSVYEKHDYAIFNVFHTWTEYINRLIGAFSGLPVLFLLILSLMVVKKDPILPLLAFGVLVLLLFEAWLGKVVVDSNLAAYKISLHMGGALLIVAFLLLLLRRAGAGAEKVKVGRPFKWLLIIAVILGLIQIGLGTQVREAVDALVHGGVERGNLVDALDTSFYIHRSFAWSVLAVTVLLVWQNFKQGYRLKIINVLGFFVILELLGGVVLAYAGMPAFAQPIHLFFAFLMFALSFFALLSSLDIRGRISR